MAARLANADKLLTEAGIEPQPIAPKVLVPLLESASLEDDPYLSEAWDSLLANAANPAAQTKIDGNLVDILKQLNAAQSWILYVVGMMLEKVGSTSSEEKTTVFLSTQLLKENMQRIHELKPEVVASVNDEDFYISLDNLARLRLCTLTGIDALDTTLHEAGKMKEAMVNMGMFQSPGHANLSITYLGLAFLAACDAPKKASGNTD